MVSVAYVKSRMYSLAGNIFFYGIGYLFIIGIVIVLVIQELSYRRLLDNLVIRIASRYFVRDGQRTGENVGNADAGRVDPVLEDRIVFYDFSERRSVGCQLAERVQKMCTGLYLDGFSVGSALCIPFGILEFLVSVRKDKLS